MAETQKVFGFPDGRTSVSSVSCGFLQTDDCLSGKHQSGNIPGFTCIDGQQTTYLFWTLSRLTLLGKVMISFILSWLHVPSTSTWIKLTFEIKYYSENTRWAYLYPTPRSVPPHQTAAERPPRPGRRAWAAERLSTDERGRSSGFHPSCGAAERSESGSAGPARPIGTRWPEWRCRNWLQSHHRAGEEPCAQSGEGKGRQRGISWEEWDAWLGIQGWRRCTSGSRNPPWILSPKGMVRFHITRVCWGRISFSSLKNFSRLSL